MSGPERYIHGHHESVLRSHSWRTAENSAAYLLPRLFDGARVLDVGSGPGTITADLARRVDPGEVIGIDASADVVERAQGLAADEGLRNLSFRTGDAYALDFDDASFDVVHAHQVLQHLADPVRALAEWRRVLKPGGTLAVRDVDYGATVWAPADPTLTRWLEVYHQTARAAGGEPDAGRHLKSWVRAAGFEKVDAGASVWCFSSEVDREWWGESWADRVVASSFAAQSIELAAATIEQLDEMRASWLAWRDSPDAWFALTHAEVLATR